MEGFGYFDEFCYTSDELEGSLASPPLLSEESRDALSILADRGLEKKTG